MLSRLALKSAQDVKPVLTVLLKTTHTSAIKNAEAQRDTKAFPRRSFPHGAGGKVRMGFIPDEWFTFFYPKTGVTGPYLFGVSFLTYLYSKEILIMEHEFYTGISLAMMIYIAVKKLGPKVAATLDQITDEENEKLDSIRTNAMEKLETEIEHEKKLQWQIEGNKLVFEAKKENIGLQLEAAYRDRLAQAHAEVKRHLDYQLETANTLNRIEQRHMVNWIIEGVKKSITPALEAATMKQCMTELKTLAAKQ